MISKSILGMLTDTERELLRATESQELGKLDEDGLVELHDRARRARNKYSKLYRRRASGQVRRDASRAWASKEHARTATKAEVFEDALARVSRALARAAKASADELRAERLAAARSTQSGAPKAAGKAAGKARKSGAPMPRGSAVVHRRTGSRSAGSGTRKTPIGQKTRASARAQTKRSQAKRDSR